MNADTTTCEHPRRGQWTDLVIPNFTLAGHETRYSDRLHNLTLYRCACGRLWSAWMLDGMYVWTEADEPLPHSRRKAGWRRTYLKPDARRIRWWR